MNLIVAVDNNWAIGNKGELLVHISEDLKRFKELTTGKVVVLGRKTLSTFPNGQPLKNRANIILSHDLEYIVSNALVVHSVNELLTQLKIYPKDSVFIIGGASVYNAMLPYCDVAYITKIDYEYDADAYFPDLSAELNWEMTEISDIKCASGIKYTFQTWKRIV